MNSAKPPIGQFGVLLALVGLLILGLKYFKINAPAAPSPSLSPSITASQTDQKELTRMTIHTDKGDIKLELFDKEAPKTVDNFKRLAERNYYNGIIFHRVIQDFMIQTGDPTGTGSGGESADGADFADEINDHKIEAGTLAMANRGPNTNGSQFFIVTEKPQPHLDGHHTVFGHVVEGMDVVRTIAMVEVDGNNKPTHDVRITSVTADK